MDTFWLALIFTFFAGMSTLIGGFIVIFKKNVDEKFLSFSMGFSAGVMIFISLANLYPRSIEVIGQEFSFLLLILGVISALLIDFLIPKSNPIHDEFKENNTVFRIGVFNMIAIGFHNFPEGAATFFATTFDISLGFSIMIAIALHNIPEGIAVAAPIYYSTKSKYKSIFYTFISGITEPMGALVAAFFVYNISNEFITFSMLAFVSGLMLFIAFDELIPAAHKYGHNHISVSGLFLGMFLIGLSTFI